MPARPSSSPRDEKVARHGWIAPVVCILIGVLYSVGTSQHYSYADDSLPFANVVLRGGRPNVHHLALLGFHHLAHGLGIQTLASTILFFKLYVVATGVLCLWLVFDIAMRHFQSRSTALVSVLFCAFAFGTWSYSITTDLYVPAAAFALLAVWLVSRAAGSSHPLPLLLLASLSVVLSAVNHQAYSLIAVPLFATLLWAGRRRLSPGQRLRRGLIFCVPAVLLGFGVFFIGFHYSKEDSFWHFLRGYQAWMRMLPYDSLQALTPVYILIGIGRTLVFPDYMLKFDAIYDVVQAKLPLKTIMDDRYLIADVSRPVAIALLALGVLACCCVLLLSVVAARKSWRHCWRFPWFRVLLGWVGIQTIFFALWEPASNEFWIWLIPCLALLVIAPSAWALRGTRAAAIPWALVLMLAVVNGPVIQRYGTPDRCIYRVNRTYLERLAPEDLVITGDGYPGNWLYSLYHSRATRIDFYRSAVSLSDSSLQAQLTIVAQRGGRVFLDPGLVMPNVAELNLQNYFYRVGEIHVDVDEAERELLRLEVECRTREIPLYGVVRKGGDVVPFRQRPFDGWIRYVTADSL